MSRPVSNATYSIEITDGDFNSVFDGFFSVDPGTGAVVGFYDTQTPTLNLLRAPGSTAYAPNDNSFDAFGTNDGGLHGVGVSSMPYFAGSAPDTGFYLQASTPGNPGDPDFHVGYVDGAGNNQDFFGYFAVGALPDPPCFDETAEILCLVDGRETYVSIADIRVGDSVKTYREGYRRVRAVGKGTLVNAPGNALSCCMFVLPGRRDPDGRDLLVTGGHQVLVDPCDVRPTEHGIRFLDKVLVFAGESHLFRKITDDRLFTFYHLCLDGDGDGDGDRDRRRFVIYANGALAETTYYGQFMEGGFTHVNERATPTPTPTPT